MPVKENDRMNLGIAIVQTQPTTQLVSANAVCVCVCGHSGGVYQPRIVS